LNEARDRRVASSSPKIASREALAHRAIPKSKSNFILFKRCELIRKQEKIGQREFLARLEKREKREEERGRERRERREERRDKRREKRGREEKREERGERREEER